MTDKTISIMGMTIPIGNVIITIVTVIGAIYYLNSDISRQINSSKIELQHNMQDIRTINQVDSNKLSVKLDTLSERFTIMAIDVDRIKKDNGEQMTRLEFEKWLLKVNKEKNLELPDVK